jgi:hypothetical protein
MDAALLYEHHCPQSKSAPTCIHDIIGGVVMRGRRVSESAVYRFTWWDRYAGKDIVSPRSATLEAITRCKGTPIDDTRQVVNSRDVDSNGFYSIPNG